MTPVYVFLPVTSCYARAGVEMVLTEVDWAGKEGREEPGGYSSIRKDEL